MTAMKKFYVTKYWSTQGIQVVECAEEATYGKSTYARTKMGLLRIGNVAFRTPEAAKADVKKRAAKKIAWLEKKAAEVRQMLAELG